METIRTEIDKYKHSRFIGEERRRNLRESRADRVEYSLRRSTKNPRNADSRDRRNRRRISEDQCISLLPSAASDPKENKPKSKTAQSTRDQWNEKRKIPLANSTPHQEIQLDHAMEFPPLGVSSFSTTPEVNKDWGTLIEEEEASLQKTETNPRSKRKLLLSGSHEQNPPRNKSFIVDENRLLKRQKQINYGKNTLAYGRYIAAVRREDRTKDDPNTPDKFQGCSTRSWVGQIKIWRRKLHVWDPPSEGQEDLFSSSQSIQSIPSDVKMEVDSICDADDDMMSTSTPSSIDDLFGSFDLDACLMNDGLPL